MAPGETGCAACAGAKAVEPPAGWGAANVKRPCVPGASLELQGDGAPAADGALPARRKRNEPTPVQRALGLLTRREHSGRELVRKLTARGVEADEAQATVRRLAEAGWQDDARFAEMLVRSRAGAGQGPVRIRAELGTHGLPREAVAAALDAFEGEWAAQARDLVRRRFGAVAHTDLRTQRKAADFLIRRGFTADQVRAAIRFDPDDPWSPTES
jgi:regulatory protein